MLCISICWECPHLQRGGIISDKVSYYISIISWTEWCRGIAFAVVMCFCNLRYLSTWCNNMNIEAFAVKTQCSHFKYDSTKRELWWRVRSMNNAVVSASEWQQKRSLVNVNASQDPLTPMAWSLPGTCNPFAASCLLVATFASGTVRGVVLTNSQTGHKSTRWYLTNT